VTAIVSKRRKKKEKEKRGSNPRDHIYNNGKTKTKAIGLQKNWTFEDTTDKEISDIETSLSSIEGNT